MAPPVNPSAPPAGGSLKVEEEVKVKAEGPKPPPTESTEETVNPDLVKQWVSKFSAGLAWGCNGENDSNLFGGCFGDLGDQTSLHLDFAIMHDLAMTENGKFRWRLGGQLNFDRWFGDTDTLGSNLNAFTIGPRTEIDWRRAYPWENFAGPSRLGIFGGIGYGWGTTVAETSNLHKQSGLAGFLGTDLNILNFAIGGLETGADFWGATDVIDGNRFNSADNRLGFQLTFRAAPRPEPEPEPAQIIISEPKVEVVEKITCDDLKGFIREHQDKIYGTNGQPGLLAQINTAEVDVARLRKYIETRESYPLDVKGVRDVLREQMVDRLVQEAAPKDDAAKEKAIAVAEAEAVKKYPANYNHWETVGKMPDASQLEVPEKTP